MERHGDGNRFVFPHTGLSFLVCKADFEQIGPVDGKVNAQQARQKMVEAGLQKHVRSCMKVLFFWALGSQIFPRPSLVWEAETK